MRLNRLVLCGLFSVLATVASAGNSGQEPKFLGPPAKLVTMPDYEKWTKTMDHSTPGLHGETRVQIHDEHYEYINPEETEGSLVQVFHNPDTDKLWFALYVHAYKDPQKQAERYLFETNTKNQWVLVQDVSKENAEYLVKLIESRYNIFEIKK